jgi:D-sedoheptulose 7-phosphate isomerase
LCDVTFSVPSRIVARIQEIHILIGHSLCAALEAEALPARQESSR